LDWLVFGQPAGVTVTGERNFAEGLHWKRPHLVRQGLCQLAVERPQADSLQRHSQAHMQLREEENPGKGMKHAVFQRVRSPVKLKSPEKILQILKVTLYFGSMSHFEFLVCV
jgi:hypothetical protein